jgi:hypothetical protein
VETDGLVINSDVRLVLITGGPGTTKSTVAKILYGAQGAEWRMLSLDDYFYLQAAKVPGDAWDMFEANAPIRAAIIRYIGDRRGRVIAEGIIQSDREVELYGAAMGVSRTSPAVKLIELRCPREIAANRMFNRPIKEDSQVGWTLDRYRGHYDWLTAKLKATGSIRVPSDGSDPTAVAAAVVDSVNASL